MNTTTKGALLFSASVVVSILASIVANGRRQSKPKSSSALDTLSSTKEVIFEKERAPRLHQNDNSRSNFVFVVSWMIT